MKNRRRDTAVASSRFKLSTSQAVARSIAAWTLMIVLGCGGTTPSAPPPKNGFHTEQQTYERKPTPNVPVTDLGDCVLSVESTPVRELNLPPLLRAGNIVGFKGTIVHPDARMTGGFMAARLTYNDDQGREVIANESSGSCIGKDGRLPFQFELRLLKGPVRQHRLRLTFDGLRPGQKVDEPLDNWTVPIAEQSFELGE